MQQKSLDWPAWLLADDEALTVHLAQVTETEWQMVLEQALRHQLAPMLYWRLKDKPARSLLPASVLERLSQSYRAAAHTALSQQVHLRRILRGLGEAAITPVVLKGALLAQTVYPSPVCRPMGDIDLWVQDDEIAPAWAMLEEMGYAHRDKGRRPLALQEENEGEVQFWGGEPHPMLIELHWGAFPGEWLKVTTRTETEAMRQRMATVSLLGEAALALSPEDNLIQVATHVTVNHRMSVAALRSLLDMALIARQGIDWDILAERAHQWRLASAMGYALEMAQAAFGTEAIPGGRERLALSPLRRAWLMAHINPVSLLTHSNRRLTTIPWRSHTLQIGLIDRPADLGRLLLHSLWPEDGWLEKRYGERGWAVRLRHTTAALRGRF